MTSNRKPPLRRAAKHHENAKNSTTGGPVRPPRRIIWIEPPDKMSGWRILVSRHDYVAADKAARYFQKVPEATLIELFAQITDIWPEILTSSALAEMADALRAFRYTVSKTVREEQVSTNERKAFFEFRQNLRDDVVSVRDKTALWLSKDQAAIRPMSTEKRHALVALAAASTAALEQLPNFGGPHRQQAWHLDARLIAWHSERVLRASGFKLPIGNNDESPLVRLTRKVLSDFCGDQVGYRAIANVLQSNDERANASEQQIEDLDPILIA